MPADLTVADAGRRANAEVDRLKATLDAELGIRGLRGWEHRVAWTIHNAYGNLAAMAARRVSIDGFVSWSWFEGGHDGEGPYGTAPTALEAMEAAQKSMVHRPPVACWEEGVDVLGYRCLCPLPPGHDGDHATAVGAP